ncbi:MAG TPA: flagellar basal body P-ring formation chaperone FlgA [Gemmatimonadales bacterium]|nr:flagellar basal body P-ring formation chaperone FlgA [Gemmatimonadales bacterium]
MGAVVGLVLAAGGAAGQGRGAAVPAAVSVAVAFEIAGRWGVEADGVRLEWGAVPAAAAVRDSTPFRLVGKGMDGSFVVVFEPAGASPAAVRVRAGVADSAVRATRALARGTVLAAEDLRTEPSVQWGPPREGGDMPAAGWTTLRPLASGDLVTSANAAMPQIVKAGDPVRVEWRRGGVLVALDGVALNPAGVGQPVRVRLGGRGGQRSGQASGPGLVSLDS